MKMFITKLFLLVFLQWLFTFPFVSRLLVSASQDGKLIIWDSYTTNKVRLTDLLQCCSTVSIKEENVTFHDSGCITLIVLKLNSCCPFKLAWGSCRSLLCTGACVSLHMELTLFQTHFPGLAHCCLKNNLPEQMACCREQRSWSK